MFLLETQKFQSQGLDTISALYKAVELINKKVGTPKNVIFATSCSKIEAITKIIYEAFPDSTTMGIYTFMYHNSVVNEDSVSLFVFEEDDDAVTVTGLIEHVSICPVKSIALIEDSIMKVAPDQEDTICIEFTTGGEEMLVSTLNAAFGHFNIPLIGGTANASHKGMVTAVIYNGVIYKDACIYLLMKNKLGRIKVFSENIFKKYNNKLHFATKVDLDSKALIEIDGKPAAEVLSKEINIPVTELAKYPMKYPLGRFVGDSSFIIGYHDIGKDGTLYNYKQVNLNDIIYVMEASDYKEIFSQSVSTLKSYFENIGFILSIDCINRYTLYKNDNYFEEYANEWYKAFGHHFGLVSAGEQFCRQHINQAMVCAVFETIRPVIL